MEYPFKVLSYEQTLLTNKQRVVLKAERVVHSERGHKDKNKVINALLALFLVTLHPNADLCVTRLVGSRRCKDIGHHSSHAFNAIVMCSAAHIHIHSIPDTD